LEVELFEVEVFKVEELCEVEVFKVDVLLVVAFMVDVFRVEYSSVSDRSSGGGDLTPFSERNSWRLNAALAFCGKKGISDAAVGRWGTREQITGL
jgi:hypothetical protein